uniref:Uncharacterized protein n=1 Tax=Varanus komodoensis TaxID=61221 RepID=A0A8D2J490_VARKO
MRMEEPWWKGELVAEIHQTLRLKVRFSQISIPPISQNGALGGLQNYMHSTESV